MFYGTHCTLHRLSGGPLSDSLKEATVPVQNATKCQIPTYENFHADQQLCVGGGKTDSCQV